MEQQQPLGLTLKKSGIKHVESAHGDFLAVMREVAEEIDRNNGHVTTDDLRAYADRFQIEAPTPNCWGAILKGGDWRIVGFQPSKRPGNHYRKIFRYTRVYHPATPGGE